MINIKRVYLKLEKYKNYFLIIFDFIFLSLSILLSNLIRVSNFNIFSKIFLIFYLFSLILFFLIAYNIKFYNLSFRYYNFDTQKKIFRFVFFYILILFLFVNLIYLQDFPRSLSLIFPVCLFFLIISSRLIFLYLVSDLESKKKYNLDKKKAIFIGLESFVRNYNFFKNFSEYDIEKVLTFKKKTNFSIGNTIVGNFSEFEETIKNNNYEVVIVTEQTNHHNPEIIEICKKYVVEILKFDEKKYFKDFNYKAELKNSDYLLRPELSFNKDKWSDFFKDKAILISGGGGTIGSGVAKFLSNVMVKKIIIADHSEYRLWRVKEELKLNKNFHLYDFKLIDFSNELIINKEFFNLEIDCIIHAAAYKHVNIVESNILTSLYNNIISTENLINLANSKRIKNFLLISSDKAVEPENIMGVSKRICELQILDEIKKNLSDKRKTNFNIVRFGNVFGSSGSLIEIIDQKIKNNQTLEITDLKAKRYFMSIEEASFLILDIIVNETKNDDFRIYVLDMGKEILLNDFIINYINRKYDQDIKELKNNDFIKTKIIGLQKGEKLNEKLSFNQLNKSNFNLKILYEVQKMPADSIIKEINELIVLLNSENKKYDDSYLSKLIEKFKI